MALTVAQSQALKAAIAADATLAAIPHTQDGAQQVADAFNQAASPAFVVWKTNVSVGATGDAINATELAGLTSLNTTRLQTIAQYAPNGFNPSLADRRQAFNDIFSGSGGAVTRPALLAIWKRNATRGEKLYATGTGSDASPATLVFEGSLAVADVVAAWNS